VKSTVEQISPTRVRINVEVPFDELKPSFDRVYTKLASMVRIPGFRPGKAPARILESRIGRGAVLDEVVQEAVPAKYAEVISGGEVRPIGRPEIEVTTMEDGKLLAFSAEVDVRPAIDLPAYDSLSVTVDDGEVGEDEADEQLEALRARFGNLKGVDRPVADGDFVIIDLSATVDEEDIEDARTTGLSYQVGSGELVDGIDEALIGAGEGDTRTFDTTLVAGEHAGRQAQVTVTVTSVKERELPPADDDFAQLASEFDTLDELRADLRERLGKVKRLQRGVQARDRVLEALLAVTEVPLPQAVVDSEVEMRKHDAGHVFDHDDARLSEWLESHGQTVEQFDAEIRTGAEQAVKTQLVLDAIADAEEIEVTEAELTERILYQAQRHGIGPEEYLRRAQETNQLGALFAEVRRGKAIAAVLRNAKVVDSSGNEVDVEKLFGPLSPPTPDEPASTVDAADTTDAADTGTDTQVAPADTGADAADAGARARATSE
jgi:trigger factor